MRNIAVYKIGCCIGTCRRSPIFIIIFISTPIKESINTKNDADIIRVITTIYRIKIIHLKTIVIKINLLIGRHIFYRIKLNIPFLNTINYCNID